MKTTESFSTKCVHSGEIKDSEGAPHTPIYNTTTFAFDSTEALLDVVDGRKPGNLYTRYGLNPSIRSLEEKLAALESAPSALAFCSGMAAESALFLSLGRKGIVCLADAYGGTLDLLKNNLGALGIPSYFVSGSDEEGLLQALEKKPDIVFFETPTNPSLEILDIKKISEISHRYGALCVVDNTFATPVNQNPLLLGADIVVHSATKYLGGHSDITAGAIMTSSELAAEISFWRKNLGQMLSPETASLLARSIRSLDLRVRHQNDSAMQIAAKLSRHPKIKKVFYPGLPDSQGHEIAKTQMRGFGGMMSVELNANPKSTVAFVDSLKIFKIAPSLGGAESLVTQPVTTTHHGLSPEELSRRGINGSMVRLSIGFESPDDLFRDLEQALEAV